MRMPTGYLATTGLVGACTLLALAPLRRPFALGAMSFVLGFVLNELPFVVFYYLVASTLLAGTEGDLGSPVGWVGAGLASLATAGLGVVIWRGLSARPALDRALSESLGPGWRSTIDAELESAPRRHLPLTRILFVPFFYRCRDVKRVANIRYGEAGRKNRLDVYRRRSPLAGAPVLVHLHGGFLFMGKKNREALPLVYRLASQGWVCISANYRLRPSARFPDHLIDVKKVIGWVREHGAEYGADPTVLFVAGSSSGAQLAALAALTPNEPAYQPGFEEADTSISAAVCMHGYYGQHDAEAGSPWSPLSYDGAGAPPFFVAHGDHDSLLSAEGARLFAGRLRRSSSNPVVYAELPGAQHGFDRFHSLRFDAVVDAIDDFAAWVRTAQL
jgi:acetyl esterase/lipase